MITLPREVGTNVFSGQTSCRGCCASELRGRFCRWKKQRGFPSIRGNPGDGELAIWAQLRGPVGCEGGCL